MQEFTLNCPGQNERTKIGRAIFLVCVLFIRTETTNGQQICQSFESVNTSQEGVCHILCICICKFYTGIFLMVCCFLKYQSLLDQLMTCGIPHCRRQIQAILLEPSKT